MAASAVGEWAESRTGTQGKRHVALVPQGKKCSTSLTTRKCKLKVHSDTSGPLSDWQNSRCLTAQSLGEARVAGAFLITRGKGILAALARAYVPFDLEIPPLITDPKTNEKNRK